jgi:predicted secreted protein
MGTPQAGRISDLDIETTVGGGTYTALGGLQDANLKVAKAEIDVSDKDSGGWDEFIPGQGSATIDGSLVYEEDDAGQALLITSILASDVRSVRFRMWGVDPGQDQWVCNGFITSADLSSPNKEALGFSFSIRLTGKPTKSTQP